MAFLNVPALVMRPTALVLNIVVATIATARFAAAGHFSARLFWPFAVTSVPFAFIGGSLLVPSRVYSVLVALVLIAAAAHLGLEREATVPPVRAHRLPRTAALLSGGAIGLLSGLTGTGGGIFLSPLLLFMGWAETRASGGVSAAFILVNSIAGLAGNLTSVGNLPSLIPVLVLTAAIGGTTGSTLGSGRLATQSFRRLLAVVLIVAAGKLIFA